MERAVEKYRRPLPPARPQALGWALNRGALASGPLTPAQFITVYMAPITPKYGGLVQMSWSRIRIFWAAQLLREQLPSILTTPTWPRGAGRAGACF